MAFVGSIAGDRYIYPHRGNVFPKVPKSGYTAAVGDLVTLDASIASGVDLIAGTEVSHGIVEVINADGTLSVVMLLPGTEIELPVQATAVAAGVALGTTVKFSSNTRPAAGMVQRTRVQVGASGSEGIGFVVAVDADCPHGLGHLTLRIV